MTGQIEVAQTLVHQGIRHASIEATVFRADGRIEPLGVIAEQHFDHKPGWRARVARWFGLQRERTSA